jgi:hypothetical protein
MIFSSPSLMSSIRSSRSTAALRSKRSEQLECFEQLKRLLSAYCRHLRRLGRVQRILRLLAIEVKSLDDRNIVDGKQDRRFALRTVDMLVPRPVGNRKTVMLVPFEHLADDARAFAAHDEIGSARRVAVSLRKTC